jgi:hypothetical protein
MEVSKETYEKALQILNLVKAEDSQDSGDAKVKEAEALKKAEETKASEKIKLENELKEALQKAEEIKAKIEGKEIVKSETASNDIVKAEFVAELQKGFDKKFEAIGTIIAKKDQENAELKKALEDQSVLVKSQSEFLTRLGEKIGIIEKQPLDRKSLSTATYIERFEKGGEGAKEGEKVLSLSNLKQRDEIATALFKSCDMNEQGIPKDRLMEKAVKNVELGFLGADNRESAQIAARLKKDHNIVVVK